MLFTLVIAYPAACTAPLASRFLLLPPWPVFPQFGLSLHDSPVAPSLRELRDAGIYRFSGENIHSQAHCTHISDSNEESKINNENQSLKCSWTA